ncbi:hypothetical protein OB985_05340 [Bacillus cereus]|uniref:hypothetical protein n=1 Tax=Bacillus tropicus TaxID=2026188 RepID=UPI000A2017C7|nr:hypothetical protein B2J90_28280 [Bacillus cereus]MCU5077001.1 hypothetical protein [Bacillus cereus]
MKTTDKLELMLDVIEKGDKDALLSLVRGMSQAEMTNIARAVPAIRSSLQYAEPPTVPTPPKYKVKETDSGIFVAFEYPLPHRVSLENKNPRPKRHLKSFIEQKEISEKYAERANTPKSEFIKSNNPEQLFDLIMQNKKEKGWKFKDEQ